MGEIPGRVWNKERKFWSVPISSIPKLVDKLLKEKVWSEQDADIIKNLIGQVIDYKSVDISSVKLEPEYHFREYQADSLRFAINRGSSLLALDMALGKTLCSLGYLYYLKKYHKIDKALIVVPVSVIWHWYREGKKFFDNKLDLVVVGNKFDADGKPKKITKTERLQQLIEPHDGYILNYEKVMDIIDNPVVQSYWDQNHKFAVIADEVTRVKSWNAKRTKALKSLPASYRVGLSGRPIENNILEFYTILDWIWPNCLGTWGQFRREFVQQNKWGKITGSHEHATLREISKYIAIQYSRYDVLKDLPPLIRNQYDVEFSPEEEKNYQKIADAIEEAIEFLGKDESKKGMMSVLSLLQISRMFCDHPILVMDSDSPTAKQVGVICNKSSKLDEFKIIVNEIYSRNEKIVVFSQFKKMVDIIERHISASYPLHKIYKSVGGQSALKKQEIIDAFNHDQNPSMFLSTDSAALGVELQTSSYIINYDLPWNPAILEQRISRLHRPGQKNPVTIINMVVEGADKVEQRVLEIIAKKNKLYQDILGEDHVSLDIQEDLV
jgi:SNF2 family DNA or RNA helicase